MTYHLSFFAFFSCLSLHCLLLGIQAHPWLLQYRSSFFLIFIFSSFYGAIHFHPLTNLSSCIPDLTVQDRFDLKIYLKHQIPRVAESQHFHLQQIIQPKFFSSFCAFCLLNLLIAHCYLLPNHFIGLLHHF